MSYLVSTKPYKLLSINKAPDKGQKRNIVSEAFISKNGIEGDAYSGQWNRQISILQKQCIDDYCKNNNQTPEYGIYGENLVFDGMHIPQVNRLDRFKIGDEAVIEVTYNQIPKHDENCELCKISNPCVFLKSGIFARVVEEGNIYEGCKIIHQPKLLRFHIVTISDRVSRGEYDDRSGMKIIKAINEHFIRQGYKISISQTIIPDDADQLQNVMDNSIQQNIDYIITTGGTGIGPRDITPEVIKPMLDKEIAGIMEAVRIKLFQTHPLALLSRNFAGIANKSLIYLLPGSFDIISDYMQALIPNMEDTLFMMHGLDIHQ